MLVHQIGESYRIPQYDVQENAGLAFLTGYDIISL